MEEHPAASKHVVIPGGSGFLGRHLSARLVARGDTVTVLTRGPARSDDVQRWVHWDARTVGSWSDALDGADAIVHLSGKRVDCRPTKRNVAALISSRVEPVIAVGEARKVIPNPPPVWIQMSSLAIFGEGGDRIINESTEPPDAGPRQMVEVCRRWEAAFHQATSGVARTVLLRAGIGIGGVGDPATERLLWLARIGLGGRVASGRQWVSWVALEDFMAVLIRAIDDASMSGPYHVTSPNPIRNAEMMATYRKLAGRRFGLPSPSLVTRMGAWMLGSDPALALTGRRALPKRLLEEGYEFTVPRFEDAAAKAMPTNPYTGSR